MTVSIPKGKQGPQYTKISIENHFFPVLILLFTTSALLLLLELGEHWAGPMEKRRGSDECEGHH